MKRYDGVSDAGCGVDMVETPNGEWVRWEDAMSLDRVDAAGVQASIDEIERLRAEVKRLKGSRVQTRVDVSVGLNRCMELRNQLRAELKHSPSELFGDGYSQAQSIFERLHEAIYGPKKGTG
jgi:hypothetical protein